MSKKNIYLFAFSFVLFIVAAFIRSSSYSSVLRYTQEVENTREVITLLERLSNHFKSAQIYSTTYEKRTAQQFYQTYLQEARLVRPEIDRLRSLIQDDARQKERLDTIARLINIHLDVLLGKNIAEIIDEGQGWRLGHLFRISYLVNSMIEREETELSARRLELSQSIHTMNIISFVLVGLAAAIIIGTFINNVLLSRKGQLLEGSLGSVLNTSQNAIVSCTPVYKKERITDFIIEFANTSFESLFDQSFAGRRAVRLRELTKDKFSLDLVQEFASAVNSEASSSFEVHFQSNDTSKWFSVLVSKRQAGITASFNDITDIRKYQHELELSIKELARSNADLEQYAYAASHDLQEPLRKIRTYATLLQEKQADQFDEKGKDHLNKIIVSAERMTMLIKDILNFSSTNKHDEFIRCDLNQLLDNIMQDLDLAITQKKARLTIHRLPIITAIPLQMSQLFYNLLSNSLKFIHPDRVPKIEVVCRKLTARDITSNPQLISGEVYYEIKVCDNGIGFTQDQAQSIFGLFKRLHGKQTYSGSGIGLALCAKVVENHNGLIYAKGIPDKGAEFYVVLPATRQRTREQL